MGLAIGLGFLLTLPEASPKAQAETPEALPLQSLPAAESLEDEDPVVEYYSPIGAPQSSLLSDMLPEKPPLEPPKHSPSRIPAFQINGLGSADLNAPVTILNFYSLQCEFSMTEHLLWVDFAKTHTIPVYGVDIGDTQAQIEQFFKDNADPYTQRGQDDFYLLSTALDIFSSPTTMIVTPDLKIRWRANEEITPQILQEHILPMIEQLQAQ